jgi:hypothetical protein
MKALVEVMLIAFLAMLSAGYGENDPQAAVPSFLGQSVWTAPGWVNVRATCYPVDGKSASGVKSRYATDRSVGCASVPSWIPRGSLIRIWTNHGRRTYLAVDRGRAVESCKAARESCESNKAKVVIDFCAPHQSWPDQAKVEIFQYVATVPFDKLTLSQKEQLMAYAQRYISQT